MTRNRTRRGFLRIGGTVLAAGATVGLAGCGGDGDGDGNGNGNGNGGGGTTLDVVPEGATSVTYADVGGMIEDDTVEGFLNEVFSTAAEQEDYDGPADKAEMLDQIESESGLDPRQMEEAVGFSRATETPGTSTPAPGAFERAAVQYSGTWFTAGWSEDDLVSAIEESEGEITLEEGEYNGYTVYEPASAGGGTPGPGSGAPFARATPGPGAGAPSARLAVIADGEYVTGTADAVRDALDVAAGDLDSVGEDLRDAYAGVRDGLLKVASSAPESLPGDSVPQGTVGEDGVEIDPERLEELQGGAVSLYTDGSEMGMAASMTAETEDAAEHVVEIIDGAIASLQKNVENEDLSAELDDVSVTRDGRSVSVDYANDLEAIRELIDLIVGELTATPSGDGQYDVALPV